MVSPEFYTDEKILELPIPARLMFIGIWNHANDEGILKNSSKQLKMQIYPADEDMTLSLIKQYLDLMVSLKLLTKGTNIDGTDLFKVTNWSDHQKINRPTLSKYVFTPLQLSEDSVRTHGGLSEDSLPIEANIKEVKLKEVKLKEDKLKVKENSSKAKDDKDEFTFDRFYQLYPRKIKKKNAEAAFKRLSHKDKISAIQGIDRYNMHWSRNRVDKEFIPHPATWLNARQWEDDLVIEEKQPKFKDEMDRQIYERNQNVVKETKRMTAYIKHADEVACDEVPDLNAMMKKESNAQPINEAIGQFMSKAQSNTSSDGE